ncbi:MAG: response regulator [Candidatus Sumerlaeia bacterium]|nr:response regulator [Candidatus Sumerlaeia bacterium]
MKILIVEDDPATRLYMEESLASQGYAPLSAPDGVRGLEIFRREHPDLIFLDIQMPGMNGLDVLKAIREERDDVIVVMNTAHGTEELAIKAMRLRANDYLNKPVRHSELLPLLAKYRAAIEAHRAAGEIADAIVSHELVMKLENKLLLVPRVADYLASQANLGPEKDTVIGVTLGLIELLNNAIEHGNLGISGTEKARLLEADPGAHQAMVAERLQSPELAARRVHIHMNENRECCEWIIRDEGNGFDYARFLGNLEAPDVLQLNGRGIFLSRFQFDEMEYQGCGNTVRVRRYKNWAANRVDSTR